MIHDHDRSGYFGASDTKYVMGNWGTKTFQKWWDTKLGLSPSFPSNIYMDAGTFYEHHILDKLSIPNLVKDKQVILEDLRLRVNLDGNTNDCIYEVKTFKAGNKFKVKKEYYQQVQVQMFATGIHKCIVVAYPLFGEDYEEFNAGNVQEELIEKHEVEYNEDFIREYLFKLKTLRDFLIEELGELNG